MKKWTWLLLFFGFTWFMSGCERGREPSGHTEHSPKVREETKKIDDMEMKELTMESIQKEGKMTEVTPGTVQISPERQQLIGVKNRHGGDEAP